MSDIERPTWWHDDEYRDEAVLHACAYRGLSASETVRVLVAELVSLRKAAIAAAQRAPMSITLTPESKPLVDAIRRAAFGAAANRVLSLDRHYGQKTTEELADHIRALDAPEATPIDCVACAMVATRRARGDNDYCCVLHSAGSADA